MSIFFFDSANSTVGKEVAGEDRVELEFESESEESDDSHSRRGAASPMAPDDHLCSYFLERK